MLKKALKSSRSPNNYRVAIFNWEFNLLPCYSLRISKINYLSLDFKSILNSYKLTNISYPYQYQVIHAVDL